MTQRIPASVTTATSGISVTREIRMPPIVGIVMARKKCVESAGPFDTSLPYLADVDVWLRLRYDAAYISEPISSVHPVRRGMPTISV